ncbi:MAG: PRC-barrel domain-containing protein [Nitrospira sp.]|nr:PRC-barrel domain-containing protein [Nitrospira sp.]
MDRQDHSQKVFPLLTCVALIVTLIAFGLTAQAGDKSDVLKASDLLGMNVEGIDGKKLGDIKDLVIDAEEGAVEYAVLEFG